MRSRPLWRHYLTCCCSPAWVASTLYRAPPLLKLPYATHLEVIVEAARPSIAPAEPPLHQSQERHRPSVGSSNILI